MERVARLAMGSRLGAVLSSLVFFLLGFFFTPFFMISAAVVALVTLRLGFLDGLKLTFYTALIYSPVSLLFFNDNLSVILMPFIIWLPMVAIAVPLRRTQEYVASLVLILGLIFLYTCLLRFAVGDIQLFWANKMKVVLDILSTQADLGFSKDQLQYLSGQIHIWWLILIESCMIGTLLLARSWQSKLYNPGGFGEEFRKIQLSKNWVIFLVTLIAVNVVERTNGTTLAISGDLVAIVLVFFALQGLSVIHYRNKLLGLSVGWLVGLYAFLFFVPQVVGLILGITGIADALADFRSLKEESPKRNKRD